jgi:5-methylcytosine-specific restriction endonuclease McrA
MLSHTERQWEGKFFRCGMRCYYCEKPLVLAEATKDHLTPVSRQGLDVISNIVPACIDCNRKKGSMTEAEFRAGFSTAQKKFTRISKPSSAMNLKDRDEKSEFDLRLESESVSWAWKHPHPA